MSTITKLHTGRWQAQVRIKGWPNQCKNFRIRKDAESWARTTEDEVTRGIYVPRRASEEMTINEALNKYIKEVSSIKSPETHRKEISQAKILKKKLGQYSLASLSTKIISQYRDNRIEEGKSNNTVRLELSLLSHMFTISIKEWEIGLPSNPVLNVRKPNPGSGRKRRLSRDEEERLIRACNRHPNPFMGWMVKLALYTAMRQGEIKSITLDQINLDDRTIFLPDTKNNESRTVPLGKKSLLVIKEALGHHNRAKDTDLLFYGNAGADGTRKPYTINKVWVHALTVAEIDDFRFHDLRHEATSRFVEAGLSDQQVSSITGHKSMQMLKRYTHLKGKDLVSIIDDI